MGDYAGVVTRLAADLRNSGASPPPMGPVTIAAGVTLTMRGSISTTPWTRTCPTDQVVVGFAGSASNFLTDLVVYCAPLSVTSGQV